MPRVRDDRVRGPVVRAADEADVVVVHVREQDAALELAHQIAALKAQHKLGDAYIAVGVDRIDYTKGLPQKFKAFGQFLDKNPQYRRQVVLTQIAPPTRESVEAYTDIRQTLEKHYKEMQDIEFTVQEGTLYMLQTRRGQRSGQAAVRIADRAQPVVYSSAGSAARRKP